MERRTAAPRQCAMKSRDYKTALTVPVNRAITKKIQCASGHTTSAVKKQKRFFVVLVWWKNCRFNGGGASQHGFFPVG
jgi:hypothetical protein